MDLPGLWQVLAAVGGVAFVVWLALVWRNLREGGLEDARWAAAALELGPGTLEVISWDTRILRPWGHSNAVASFVMRGRREGFDWLEPVVIPLQELNPVGVRALIGELGGRTVAYVHCYGRLRSESRIVARGDAAVPLVEVGEAASGKPPLELRQRLEALLAGAGSSAP